jgi:hypothetical protein
MFLNDRETETDLLCHEATAKTVVRLIRETPAAPITIGVHGDWGAGKSMWVLVRDDLTSLEEMCREELAAETGRALP